MNSEITRLCKAAKVFYERHEGNIKDIILFGSLLKGKDLPNDIDILIVFKKKIDKDLEYDFKQECLSSNVSIVSKTEENVNDQSFAAREAILFEGYSLIKKEFLAAQSGYSSLGMFVYRTRGMSNAEKTKFYYALNGRGAEGVLGSLGAIKLSDNVVLVPLDKIEPAKAFFEYWKIDYVLAPSLIPSRLAKPHIIGKLD